MGSKATILVKYFETSTTIPFPTVCPANEVPAVLGMREIYVFQQNTNVTIS
jgi:hypothetical protein